MNGMRFLGIFVTLTALAQTAKGAVLCVNAARPACHSTIQAAVDAAAPGDIVRVAAGTYFENVVVPAAKDGLQIVGAGKLTTILDPDVPNSGDGIHVLSNDVQIRNLGIRNGQMHGIVLAGNGAVVSGVRIVALRGLGSNGILALANTTDHRIESNEIRSIAGFGIFLQPGCDNAVVRGNTVTQASQGIRLESAANLQVLSNVVTGIRFDGVTVFGAQPAVNGNRFEMVGSLGLVVEGSNPVVRANRLTNGGPAVVNCTTCSGGVAAANYSLGTSGTAFAFNADAAGFTAQSNRVSYADGPAIFIDGTGVVAAMNFVTDSGRFGLGNCFQVSGAGNHTLRRNVATGCSDSGFLVNASGVTLDGNVVTGAGVNGFTIFGNAGGNADNTLVANRSSSSNAAGFAVTDGAVNTTLTGNVGAKNRYDLCDDGAGTNVGANTFGSESTVCTDVIQ